MQNYIINSNFEHFRPTFFNFGHILYGYRKDFSFFTTV